MATTEINSTNLYELCIGSEDSKYRDNSNIYFINCTKDLMNTWLYEKPSNCSEMRKFSKNPILTLPFLIIGIVLLSMFIILLISIIIYWIHKRKVEEIMISSPPVSLNVYDGISFYQQNQKYSNEMLTPRDNPFDALYAKVYKKPKEIDYESDYAVSIGFYDIILLLSLNFTIYFSGS